MKVKFQSASWTTDDACYQWSVGSSMVHVWCYGKRINLLPGIDLDWEGGYLCFSVGWLMFGFAIDVMRGEKDPRGEMNGIPTGA
jgi:hypothetical protein